MVVKSPPQSRYRYPPLPAQFDDALLDAYPEILTPLPDPEMQERPLHDIMESIRSWLGDRSDVFVSSNTGVYYEEGNPAAVFSPDCYVVFGAGADRLWWPYAYRIWEFGAPPAFALEIGSKSTWQNDLGPKRDLYARVGIGEYWRYDPKGGELYGQLLAGEYLADGAYIAFEVSTEPSGAMRGHSPTLGLDLWATDARLWFRNPDTGEFLGNVLEQQQRRQAAEFAALTEREQRLVAEAATQAAESAIRDERNRRQTAESEVARLQAELQQLRGA